jgi:hypothetical protein
MLKRMILIISLMLSACRDYEETNTLTYIEGVVLNRRVNNRVLTLDPFESVVQYQLYIYDGQDSQWYETNDSLYRALRPRDSISSYLLTTIITKQ